MPARNGPAGASLAATSRNYGHNSGGFKARVGQGCSIAARSPERAQTLTALSRRFSPRVATDRDPLGDSNQYRNPCGQPSGTARASPPASAASCRRRPPTCAASSCERRSSSRSSPRQGERTRAPHPALTFRPPGRQPAFRRHKLRKEIRRPGANLSVRRIQHEVSAGSLSAKGGQSVT